MRITTPVRTASTCKYGNYSVIKILPAIFHLTAHALVFPYLISISNLDKLLIILLLPHGENDSCGVRTHALSEWRLEPPP